MIAAYLEQLADALAFDKALAARVLPEVQGHLEEALAAEPAGDAEEAERRVVARFGDPRALAAQFAPISFMRRARPVSVAIVVATLALVALMKARVFWYAFVQWTLSEEARATARLVVTVDRYAFWAAAAIAVGALLYVARHLVPAGTDVRYRRQTRRAATMFILATVLLAVCVASDLILAILQFRRELAAVVPIASMAIEIGCIASVAVMVANTARRAVHAGAAV